MTFTQNGRVGINTENFFGNHRLYVEGSTYITENTEETHSLYIEGSSIAEEINVKPKNEWPDITTGNTITMRFADDGSNLIPEIAWNSANAENLTFKSSNSGNTPLTISPDGKVGINTDYFVNNHSLYIEGSSVAEEMYVKLKDDWPDYVFADQYELMPLNELGDFIDKNGYLPKMPSAHKVKEEGLATGETIRLLTEKVEELTLYLLQQQKEIDVLKAEIKQ
ncbi:hypothetical protein G3O08_19295 [Cryomorpha ignava]|uniref:Uncharacterized protein n=1 Tax=Cryomorpha ignava TaxID=101383 RepID=A0A7K3WVB2_9FLAO|nr:hypothetical protein [Cryomorpha ignava]NEN25643.1 hypothetical protein [Cryomorpha ignava]